jgi:hypothetical protein
MGPGRGPLFDGLSLSTSILATRHSLLMSFFHDHVRG